ncbi:PspC domain-containing protein [Arthrobacter sp. JSM 101049]|uniref:ATP-binding protein n=1 Tax=Arthrobacter sp. JSM 101049 TaxID=929097 RepID=UPI003563CC00
MTEFPVRPPLVRAEPRLLGGVCAGLALHLGQPVRTIRIAMALLSLMAGAGIVLYAWLWIMVPSREDALQDAERARAGGPVSLAPGPGLEAEAGIAAGADAGAGVGSEPRGRVATRWGSLAGREILAGAGLLLLGALVFAQMQGLPVAWGLIWPAVLIIAGAVLAWLQLDAVSRRGLRRAAGADRAVGMVRLVGGLALVVLGLVFLVSGAVSLEALWNGAFVAVIVLAGVLLVLAPWGLRFWRDYESERANRIRVGERAEIAAHLHDSVLQTLALIQKRAGDEAQVLRLARAQERELRQWLYRETPVAEGDICEAVRAEAARLEESHAAVIDVVSVGEREGLDGHDALVQAAREAMLNAAKHAGGTVSVYVEASRPRVDVFVRDRGTGFDTASLPEDRFGVRESIIGRMQRNGGCATITSSAAGTEVHLVMEQPAHEEQNR